MVTSGGAAVVGIASRVTTGNRVGTGVDIEVVTLGVGVIVGVIAGLCGVVPNEFEKITILPITTRITMASAAKVTTFDFFRGTGGVIGGTGGGDAEDGASAGTDAVEDGCAGVSPGGDTPAGDSTAWVSTKGGGAG
jgi:hypothetical protein